MIRTLPAVTITAMTWNTPLHVLPHRLGTWYVQREGDDEPLSEHGNETEAELAATREAGTGEVIVHDRYQRVHDVRRR
jgi:hypothetical protein